MASAGIAELEPRSPVSAKAVRTGPDWLHELKFDGYRVLVRKAGRTKEAANG